MYRLPTMIVLMMLLGLFLSLGCAAGENFTTVQEPAAPPNAAVVRISDSSYTVDLAIKAEERQQGLSGRAFMAHDEGMLFVFEEEQPLHFWMKEMLFPLDIIWIDAQCRLIDVAADVPTPLPGAGNEEIPIAQSPLPARYVLEVNAGEAARNGLQPGDPVEFLGAIAGEHGC